MPLSDTRIKALKPRDKKYKVADERGLNLLVPPKGSKRWVLAFRLNDKQCEMALGTYPATSLKKARQLREEAKALIESGEDPRAVKKAAKAALIESSQNTFQSVALGWYRKRIEGQYADKHCNRVLRALHTALFPDLGSMPIQEIEAPEVLACLRKIEARGHLETLQKTKRWTSQIFRFAIAEGRAKYDPVPAITDALKTKRAVKHRAAITAPTEVGGLLNAIDGYQGTAVICAALKLSPLTFLRPGELRQLEWADVNWEENRIEIPAERMKMREPHIVPLAKQACQVLRNLQPITGEGRYIFPSARGASRPLSDNGVRTALRTLGYSNDVMTPHGFRAMARTLLDEILGFSVDIIEHQSARKVRDPLGRAYNRTQHLPQRREMMQKWADYLDELRVRAPTPVLSQHAHLGL